MLLRLTGLWKKPKDLAHYLFNSVVVCAFTLSNSSIDSRNLPNKTYLYDTLNALADKSLQEYIYLLRIAETRRLLDGV